MRKRSSPLIAAIVIVLCAAGPACSQEAQLPELRIEVMGGPDEALPSKYKAELEGFQYSRKFGPVDAAQGGAFRFRNVPYGEYRLAILDDGGVGVYEQAIAVNAYTSTLLVRLPKKKTEHPPSGTVSLSQLRNPISKKALQSFSASRKSFQAGDYQRAVEELQKAIKISPGYAQAYSELAIVHIRVGLYQQAMSELSRAVDIAGKNPRDLSNMAVVEYNLERYAESMQWARSALQVDPNYNPAHFVLGAVLAMDTRTMAESMPHLERAAETMGSAKAILTVVQKVLGRE